MPRRYSYSRLASEFARDARRRGQERLKKEREQQCEAQQLYLGNRVEEADEKNEELAGANIKLLEILQHALSTENNIQFDSLRNHTKFREFDSPTQPIEPKRAAFISKEPNFLVKLLPGWQDRYQKALQIRRSKISSEL